MRGFFSIQFDTRGTEPGHFPEIGIVLSASLPSRPKSTYGLLRIPSARERLEVSLSPSPSSYTGRGALIFFVLLVLDALPTNVAPPLLNPAETASGAPPLEKPFSLDRIFQMLEIDPVPRLRLEYVHIELPGRRRTVSKCWAST